ncbi:DUF6691 family protein [Halomonas denitrificans]|nr:YeeE/YedE family protein [Halomonas denitrificans]
MRAWASLGAGLLFGGGLAVSGMTDTSKVLGFLDVFGAWDPDLAFVMGGALLVTLIGFRWVLSASAPRMAERFDLPTATETDPRLLSGAALFGIGWGLYGYCPGPAVAALAYLDWQAGLFVLSMLAGMGLADRLAVPVPASAAGGPPTGDGQPD